MDDDQLLTLAEAGALAGGVSHTTIWRRIRDGELAATNIGTRHRPRLRVSRGALRAYLRKREQAVRPIPSRRAA